MNPCSKDYIGDIKFTDTGFSYTMALISGKHKMAILYCLMKFEPVRFNEMKRFLENITDKTLSSNLKELESEHDLIVSCGGGMALRDTNAAIMKAAGTVVWLTAEPETILERVKNDDSRPLLRGNKNTAFIGDLLEKRRPKYAAAADIAVATDHRSVDDICDEIIRRISEM